MMMHRAYYYTFIVADAFRIAQSYVICITRSKKRIIIYHARIMCNLIINYVVLSIFIYDAWWMRRYDVNRLEHNWQQRELNWCYMLCGVELWALCKHRMWSNRKMQVRECIVMIEKPSNINIYSKNRQKFYPVTTFSEMTLLVNRVCSRIANKQHICYFRLFLLNEYFYIHSFIDIIYFRPSLPQSVQTR